MAFDDILEQAIELLQRRGRLTYRTLKRQFHLDDEVLDDLTFELIEGQRLAADENQTVLVWVGHAEAAPPSPPTTELERTSSSYTPASLAEKIIAGKASLEGERKVVTVLFADIKDSTELIRDLDPEDAQKLLDPAIHIMMEAVHRFEGTVNQVLGDGIMSIFGAPLSLEDHAARACYAALAMQAAMREYTEEARRKQGLELSIRVGLNSGEVVVRAIGNDLHMDYSAVGATTHLAARMEQLATPGSIRLSSSTLRLVEGFVQVKDLGPIPVKGMAEPVAVYELTGASAVRRRLQAAVARGLTTFVGRDNEIDALHRALEQAGAGHGQLVAAVGEAGVGKSRLMYEFIHSHRTQGWLILESASVSYGKATPYFPIIDLLKRYAHVEDGDDTRAIRAKVMGQILTLDESLQDTTPALLSLLDALPEDSPFLKLDPPQRRQRTLDGLKRILLRESQVQPLVLVFEDLHWHDSESQALLDNLVDSLPTAQLLLLVNYRPEYRHRWESKTYYTQVRLDPLPPESADALLDTLLGDDITLKPLKKHLIERTEGNPFFLEESVRTLLETQVLTGEPGAYCLAKDLPAIQVPTTVQAILAARIDRLPEDAKRLLQTAAVIGAEAPLTLLQIITELPEDTLYRSLAHLQAAEFLYETSLFPERIYTFNHALTHNVAYGILLQERRRALHAEIVKALESLSDDQATEQIERLAHHAFRGEIWGKALLYCRQAGDKAMEQSAYQEGVVCFEQALHALTHLPETRDLHEQAIDLRFALRSALQPSGDWERILAVLREAESLATALGDHRRLGRLLLFLSVHWRYRGAYDQSIAAAQRALTLARSNGEVILGALANQYLSTSYQAKGAYRQAMDCGAQTIAALDAAQYNERAGAVLLPAVRVRCHLAMSYAELGMFADGVTIGEQGLRIAEAAAQPVDLMGAYSALGQLALRQGNLPMALSLLERAVRICREADLHVYFNDSAAELGAAYALSGRIADAMPLLTQAMEQSMAIDRVDSQTRCRLILAEAKMLAGCLEEAHAQAEQALAFTCAYQEQGYQAYALRLLGDIAMRRHSPELDKAESHYQQALTLAEELGMRPLQAHCRRGLGNLYGKTGQSEQARAELTTAIEMYRGMEMTFWLPETEMALAAVEGAS